MNNLSIACFHVHEFNFFIRNYGINNLINIKLITILLSFYTLKWFAILCTLLVEKKFPNSEYPEHCYGMYVFA
jgi:hypothetical protein